VVDYGAALGCQNFFLLFLGKGEIGEEFLLSFNREQQKERLSFNFVL